MMLQPRCARASARLLYGIPGSLLALALAQAVPVQAQPGGAGGRPPGGPVAEAASEQLAGPAPLDRLLAALELQPEQQAAWQAYLGRLDAYLKQYYREQPAQASDSLPRQLARLVDLQQNRLAALEEIEAAVRELYKVLTPPQRQQADQLLLATLPPSLTGVSASCASSDSRIQGNDSRPRKGGRMPPGGGAGGF